MSQVAKQCEQGRGNGLLNLKKKKKHSTDAFSEEIGWLDRGQSSALVFSEVGMPEVDDEDQTEGVTLVTHFVLKWVIKGDDLPFLPRPAAREERGLGFQIWTRVLR